MSDTRRELSALQTLEADNSSGAITPQVMRDNLVSAHGSNVIQSGAYASFPSTPITGDLFYTETMVWRYSGSVWVPFGPIFQFTDPALQTWSWVNQTANSITATIDDTHGGIFLQCAADSGHNARMQVKSAPSTPYTITVAMLPLAFLCQYNADQIVMVWPIIVRDSSTGKFTSMGSFPSDAPFEIDDFSSPNGYNFAAQPWLANATYYNQYGPTLPLWYRFSDDGTNHTWSISNDGINFYQLYQRSRTAYLANPDSIGFGIGYLSVQVGINILSWKQT